jgi:hypothetical protein
MAMLLDDPETQRIIAENKKKINNNSNDNSNDNSTDEDSNDNSNNNSSNEDSDSESIDILPKYKKPIKV